MSFNGLILTNEGKEKIAATISGEEKLEFTHVKLGDGVSTENPYTKKELTNTVMEIPVTHITRQDNNEVVLDVDWNSGQAPKAFYLREIGIFANGVLCYYDNAGSGDAEYIDPASGSVSKEKRMRFTVAISDEVHIVVQTPSNLYALQKDMEELDDRKLDKEGSTMTGASASIAGKGGLVPAPAAGANTKFLRGDGTWDTPTDTKNTAGATNSTERLFLIGATEQTANPQTYSHSNIFISGGALYSNSGRYLSQSISVGAIRGAITTTSGTASFSITGNSKMYIVSICAFNQPSMYFISVSSNGALQYGLIGGAEVDISISGTTVTVSGLKFTASNQPAFIVVSEIGGVGYGSI